MKMGNDDGILEVIAAGNSDKLIMKDAYFSFALGNEIALVSKLGYHILNCDKKLFDEIKTNFSKNSTLKEAKKFWYKKSKKFEISDWSNNFEDLK